MSRQWFDPLDSHAGLDGEKMGANQSALPAKEDVLGCEVSHQAGTLRHETNLRRQLAEVLREKERHAFRARTRHLTGRGDEDARKDQGRKQIPHHLLSSAESA